jgi:hypothetical protein
MTEGQAERLLREILKANDEFRSSLPDDWEGDPLQDACAEAKKHLEQLNTLQRPVCGALPAKKPRRCRQCGRKITKGMVGSCPVEHWNHCPRGRE